MPWGLAAAAGVALVGGVIGSAQASSAADDAQGYAEQNAYLKSGMYNPNAFDMNGDPSFAHNAALQAERQAGAITSRSVGMPDYSAANQYAAGGLGDMGSQRGIAGQLGAIGSGAVPTVAEQQAGIDMQKAIAAQSSLGASARGAAGLALAGQQAASNTANATSAISSQAQVNAAQERQNALGAAGGMYGQLQQSGLASQQQAANQAQYNSNLALQQQNANDTMVQYNQNRADALRQAQQQGMIAQQQFQADQQNRTTSQALGLQQQASQQQQQITGGVVQGISNAATGATMAMSNDKNRQQTVPQRAEGGPVASGQPYLVGERGPELVVPQQAGMVVPAGPTAQMTGDASGLAAAMRDPQKAAVIQQARQNPQIGLTLRQQAAADPNVAAKVQADPALHAIMMGLI